MLIGSLPSGDPKICELRQKLAELCFGNGHFAAAVVKSRLTAPTVEHFSKEFIPAPNVVYVGKGACALTLSPRSCPLPPRLMSAGEAARWVGSRADANSWLLRLSAKTLACNCNHPPPNCWAETLAAEFKKRFMQDIGINKEESEAEDGEEGSPEQELPPEWRAAKDDHAGTIEEEALDVPANVPWPTAWVRLVQTVRSLRGQTFWEMFAGSAGLTAAFLEEGMECGPPVDVIYDSELNLLNCMLWQ